MKIDTTLQIFCRFVLNKYIMEKLTIQEEQAMLKIWKLKECAVKNILDLYEDPKPNYTTLAAVVRNLEEKGYVYAKRFGNVKVYYPQIEQMDYKKQFMSDVVNDYFENSYKKILSFFVKEKKLSTEEIRKIIEQIEDEK